MIDDSYYKQLAKIESNNNPNAKAKTSSASGLYQFIKSTWEGLGYNWSQVFDPGLQNEAIRKFTQDNASGLEKAGIPITNANLYAAHFLGIGQAKTALSANDNIPIQNVISSSAYSANNFLKGMTVGDFKNWLNKKMGGATTVNPPKRSQPLEMQCPNCKMVYQNQ